MKIRLRIKFLNRFARMVERLERNFKKPFRAAAIRADVSKLRSLRRAAN